MLNYNFIQLGGDIVSVIYDPKYRIFLLCLKDARIQSKMTQQELATVLGCGQSYVSKYEQGQKRLDIIEIRNICHCLGLSLPELISDFESRLKEGGY